MIGFSDKTVACFRLSAGGTSEEKNSSELGAIGLLLVLVLSPFFFFTTLGETGR